MPQSPPPRDRRAAPPSVQLRRTVSGLGGGGALPPWGPRAQAGLLGCKGQDPIATPHPGRRRASGHDAARAQNIVSSLGPVGFEETPRQDAAPEPAGRPPGVLKRGCSGRWGTSRGNSPRQLAFIGSVGAGRAAPSCVLAPTAAPGRPLLWLLLLLVATLVLAVGVLGGLHQARKLWGDPRRGTESQ